MTSRRYVTIVFSAAALLAVAGLPGSASATELPVPAQVVEKPQAAPVARPAVRVARRPVTSVRRSYRPVRYVSRPVFVPIRYAALEQRRWPAWTQTILLGIGF
jgi:hypothetical protein